MVYLNDLSPMKVYKKQAYLPFNLKDKRKGSAIFLLTPNLESSMNIINSNPFFNNNYFNGYYLEKDISFIIDSQNKKEDLIENTICNPTLYGDYYKLTESNLLTKDQVTYFGDYVNKILEGADSDFNTKLRKIFYNERIKNNKEILIKYDDVKTKCPNIKYTYIDYHLYKANNIFVDLSYYNNAFFRNNTFKLVKGIDIYTEFLGRMVNDDRLGANGYNNVNTIIIPVDDWGVSKENKKWNYKVDINPISVILYLLKYNIVNIKNILKDKVLLLFSNKGYFKININDYLDKDYIKILSFIDVITDPTAIIADDEVNPSSDVVSAIADIEAITKININNIDPKSDVAPDSNVDNKKEKLVKIVSDLSDKSTDHQDLLQNINNDPELQKLIIDISDSEDDTVKMSAARASRITNLNNKFNQMHMEKVLANNIEIPSTSLNIDTINDEWKDMKYINFQKAYNINYDINNILLAFSHTDYPLTVVNMETKDVSTSQDWIYTYNVQYEDVTGHRFTIIFDMPKFKNDKYMMLRGNDKTISGQLALIPVSKTDDDTVQLVSNYNAPKIFVRRYGTTTGKSYVIADKIIKTLRKINNKGLTISTGDNNKICARYDLPIDYIDLSNEFNTIEYSDTGKHFIFYFNQDIIRTKYKDIIKNDDLLLPVGYDYITKSIIYYDGKDTFSTLLYSYLSAIPEFTNEFNKTHASTKYCYSKASILNTEIPVIIVMCLVQGLQKSLNISGIEYRLSDKKSYDAFTEDYIEFEDGYLIYKLNYASSMLLNGLKESDTAYYPITRINDKAMYMDFLDSYGGRLLIDGLENFSQLFIDPITREILRKYDLPEDYCTLLTYANNLLTDNTFINHTNLSNNRYRTNELVAGYLYKVLSAAYGSYHTQIKKSKRGAVMSIKKTAVIDTLLQDPTLSDLSILTPLLEVESGNSVSFKGLAGMNSDRSYGLDKRNYDKSMLNVLALSTGFAGNAGITRQSTIDMNIEGSRGYIKITADPDKLSTTKTLSITEALTPFGTTRDDPFRSAMTFIQTSKHTMPINKSDSLLISNGADEALPYICSDTYSVKAKRPGKVIELTDTYAIIQYDNNNIEDGMKKDPDIEYIDLTENVKKNSDGGFYITLQLQNNGLKLNQKVSANQILAYDKRSFSNDIGFNDNLSYNIGTLCKVALPVTDEGYEDSAIISDWLSKAMASDVVVMKDYMIDKKTNLYNIVKKGQDIQEGQPLMIFQDAFEEDDVNLLLKNLAGDSESVTELGRVKIKSKISGKVEDIAIYRTADVAEMSDSVKKLVNDYERPLKQMKKIISKYDENTANSIIQSTDKLDLTGKLKHAQDQVLVEFYLKYYDKLSVGDKIVYFSALKGIVKDIFPAGKEPRSSFRPKERVDALLSILSVNGRMTCSPLVNGAINKVLIELGRSVKDIMEIDYDINR